MFLQSSGFGISELDQQYVQGIFDEYTKGQQGVSLPANTAGQTRTHLEPIDDGWSGSKRERCEAEGGRPERVCDAGQTASDRITGISAHIAPSYEEQGKTHPCQVIWSASANER